MASISPSVAKSAALEWKTSASRNITHRRLARSPAPQMPRALQPDRALGRAEAYADA
jgi:hypothetical protein